jgi:hypothetical protein
LGFAGRLGWGSPPRQRGDRLFKQECGALDAGHRHQVRLSLAQRVVRFVDRALALGDDRRPTWRERHLC